MPKLQEYRETYYFYSGKVSDIVRTLSLSAIGIIWLLKKETDTGYQFSTPLYFSLAAVIICVVLDLAQYAYGAHIWKKFYREKENQNVSEEEDIYAPEEMNTLSYRIFWAKVFDMFTAYICLFLNIIPEME